MRNASHTDASAGSRRFAPSGIILLTALSAIVLAKLGGNRASADEPTKHTVCPFTLYGTSGGTYIYNANYCISQEYYGAMYFSSPPANLECANCCDDCQEELVGSDALKEKRAASHDAKRTRFARLHPSVAAGVKPIKQGVKKLDSLGNGVQMDGKLPFQIARFDDNKYARVFLVKGPLKDKSVAWSGFGFELDGKPDDSEPIVDMQIEYHEKDGKPAKATPNYYVLKQPDYENSSDFIYYHVLMQAK